MEKRRQGKGFIIANNVRSAVNVGSLFRIAESTGMAIILQGITPHPKTKNDDRLPYVIENDTKKISKTAVYSIAKVEWYYFKTVEEVLDFLPSHSKSNEESKQIPVIPDTQAMHPGYSDPESTYYTLYSLEEGIKNSTNIYSKDFKVKHPFALVVGNEVNGVEKKFINASKKVLYLPMKGSQSSINVAVSTAVACFHLIYGLN